MQGCIIKRVTLQNFRCFDLNRFDFSNVTYICGANGSGKTSILEAIGMIDGRNSFRAKTMESMVKNGIGQFEIMAETCFGDIFIQHNMLKKTAELDGEKQSNQDLRKIFNIVIYTPNYELSLATDAGIRSYMDKLACSIFFDHEKLLTQCKDLFSERMKILLTSNNNTWVTGIETQIAQILTIIFYNRLTFIQKIQKFFNDISAAYTIELDNPYIKMLKNEYKFSQIEHQITQELERTRIQDKEQGRSSNIANDITYNITCNKRTVEYCSSGEQKLTGALIAVATGYCASQIKNNVVVLLDDITAKIDDKNQEYLYSVIHNTKCQTVISSVTKPHHSTNCIEL